MRTKQKGLKVIIAYKKGKQTTFKASGRKRYPIGDGMVAVNGTIKFADGTFAYAVLEIDESSSGEHHGTGIFLLDGDFVFQGDPDFLKKLHKTAAERRVEFLGSGDPGAGVRPPLHITTSPGPRA